MNAVCYIQYVWQVGNFIFSYPFNGNLGQDPTDEEIQEIIRAADIDGDSTMQNWGYAQPNNAGGVVSADAAASACDAGLALSVNQVGPCDATHGRSVF